MVGAVAASSVYAASEMTKRKNERVKNQRNETKK